jgi:hypothetical protein
MKEAIERILWVITGFDPELATRLECEVPMMKEDEALERVTIMLVAVVRDAAKGRKEK